MAQRVIEDIAALKGLVGQEVGVSDWLTVDQALINAFAEVTGDRQWIHLDEHRCQKDSPYRTTIAHGFLTLSLLTQLHTQAVAIRAGQSRGINYGLNRVRFPNAVLSGSRIRGHSALQAHQEIEGGLQLTWLISVEIEGQPKPAVVAEWLVRLYT